MNELNQELWVKVSTKQKFMINRSKGYDQHSKILGKDCLLMPQICFHSPQDFYCFLTLLGGNNENNIFSRLHIDLRGVSYQNNHPVDCILFFCKF